VKSTAEDFLSNKLAKDIIIVTIKLVKFDILNKIKRTNLYAEIFANLVKILEYNKSNPQLSYNLRKIRYLNKFLFLK
jgi:hypothetical protein